MKSLIKEERQGDDESNIEHTASTEEPLSLKKEAETHTLSSDESDFEQVHSVTSIKKQLIRASPPTQRHCYEANPPVSGPYQIGSFIKITNQHIGAQGTVGKVISS